MPKIIYKNILSPMNRKGDDSFTRGIILLLNMILLSIDLKQLTGGIMFH